MATDFRLLDRKTPMGLAILVESGGNCGLEEFGLRLALSSISGSRRLFVLAPGRKFARGSFNPRGRHLAQSQRGQRFRTLVLLAGYIQRVVAFIPTSNPLAWRCQIKHAPEITQGGLATSFWKLQIKPLSAPPPNPHQFSDRSASL